MKARLSILAALLLFAALGGCATTERLSAAGDVRTLLVAIRDDDKPAFDAHVDRRALEAQIQARIVDRAARGGNPDAARGLGLLLSGPLARAASAILIQPEVFRAVADYYGYRPDTPIPNTFQLTQILKALPDGRVCAARTRRGPCLLTFAREDGVWRLVAFDGDAGMLRLKSGR